MMWYDDIYPAIYREIATGTAAISLPGWARHTLDDFAEGRSSFAAVRHPLGFLCLPVERSGDLGVCLHIWSPEVPSASPTTSPLHCHSWDLVSFVLYGTVRNMRAHVVDDGSQDATHRIFEVVSGGEIDELRATGRTVHYSSGDATAHRAGDTYTLPAGVFHSTFIEDGHDAATVALGRRTPDGLDLSLGPLDAATHQMRRQRCDPDTVARVARRSTGRIAAAHPTLVEGLVPPQPHAGPAAWRGVGPDAVRIARRTTLSHAGGPMRTRALPRTRTLSPPVPHVDLAAVRREAVEIAEAAGGLLRARITEPFAIHAKGTNGDIVTELDMASEALILERLRAAYPGHGVIAEESGVGGVTDADLVWLVDPLDGTNNVAVGMAVYAVGLALCAESIPVLGVIHDPVTGCTWSAVRDEGASASDGSPLRLDERPSRADKPVLGWVQGHDVGSGDPAALQLRSLLEVHSHRLLQLWAPLVQWVMLARGDIDGVVGYRPELVDLPAGYLLAREAGAEIRGLDGGPYDLSIDLPAAERGFVAARPGMLDRLLDITADAFSR